MRQETELYSGVVNICQQKLARNWLYSDSSFRSTFDKREYGQVAFMGTGMFRQNSPRISCWVQGWLWIGCSYCCNWNFQSPEKRLCWSTWYPESCSWKTSSFKHAAWSKDSILCFWRDAHSSDTYCLYEADTLNCLYQADTPPYCLQLVAARTCCAVNVLTSRISFFSRDLGGWGPWSSIIC